MYLLWRFGYALSLNHHLLVQQDYFGVSPFKIRSEFSDHCDPFDKLSVEGFKSIREMTPGSGISLGLRPVGGGASFGGEAQPLNAGKISAMSSIAGRLCLRESICVLLGCCRVRGVFVGFLIVFHPAGDGALLASLGGRSDQLAMLQLLGVQAVRLHQQQYAKHQGEGLETIGFYLVDNHGVLP